MSDTVTDVFALLAGILLLFLLPLAIVTLNMDNTSQGIISNAVVEFTDNARSSAVITSQSYEKLCNSIDSVQKNCRVEITHSSKCVTADGADLYYYYSDYTKEDILNTIYTLTGNNADYRMKNGDYLTVKVYNTKPTLGSQIFGLLLPGYGSGSPTLYSVYSGMIGNNPE